MARYAESFSWPAKDPEENLDYKIDWSERLDEGDTIVNSVWIVPSGITNGAMTMTATETTIWLSGGSLNTTYEIANRVTTAAGRIMDQTVRLPIRRR